MDKKKGVKLGVCSLLVGLLALTACSKKTTTATPTTVKPTTTKRTTDKVTSNTTRRTTTQKITTQDLTNLARLDVYIGTQKISDEYNVIDVTYGENYDLESLVMVRGVKENGSEVVLTDFDVVTELTPTSNVGTYDVTISYGNLTPVTFSVKVNQKEIDVSLLEWDYTEAFTYDGTEKSVQLKDIPTGLNVSYETNEAAGNSATNAGTYETMAVLSVVNDNYKLVNVAGPVHVVWKINKATINMANANWSYTEAFTYDGSSKYVNIVNLPEGVSPVYSGTTLATDAGNYFLSVSFDYDTINYELINDEIFQEELNWKINKATINMAGVAWDYTEAFTYDGEEKQVSLTNLPTGVIANYAGDTSATNAGTYNVEVTYSYNTSNYVLENVNIEGLEWTINKKQVDFTNVHWDYTTPFTYDGADKEVRLVNVPEGIVINYFNTKYKTAGNHYAYFNLMAEENNNYDIINISTDVYSINWMINKATINMADVDWNYAGPFTYDGEEKQVSLTNLPTGVTANYTGDTAATDAGTYNISVTFSYDTQNYELENVNVSSLEWKINKVTYDFTNVCWNYSSPLYYCGADLIVSLENVPAGVSVSYTNNKKTDAGTYTATVTIDVENDNYEIINDSVPRTLEWEIKKIQIDFTNVSWNYSEAYTYDGEEHSVYLNALPLGINPVYTGTRQATNAGEYTVTVSFPLENDNYEIVNYEHLSLTLEWKINKATIDMANVAWNYTAPFTYDTSTKSVSVTNLPDGVTASYTGSREETNAGTYTVSVTFDFDTANYELANLGDFNTSLSWKINKAQIDMANANWDYTDPFTYDTSTKSVSVTNLPDGITASYTGSHEETNAGNYTVSVSFNYDTINYELINASKFENALSWKINKAQIDMANANWNYTDPFTYDTSTKSVSVTNLPDGITASYTGSHEETNAGNYTVSVSFNYDITNYELINASKFETALSWKINKATIDMTSIAWDYEGPFTFDTSTKYVNVINVPELVSVLYQGDHLATEAGNYTASVEFSYDAENYELINLDGFEETISWTINKATAVINDFSVKSKVYDGEAVEVVKDADTDGYVRVYFKKISEEDSEYNTYVPTDAGYYKAKFVIEGNVNYTDLEDYYFEFYILKKTVDFINGPYDNYFITDYTGAEQTLDIPGYDDYLMYLKQDGVQVEAVKATTPGQYHFEVYLVDTINYCWNGSSSAGKGFAWIVSDNYFTQIIVNGAGKSYDEFLNTKFKTNDQITLSVKDGYDLYINGSPWTSGNMYQISYSISKLTLEVRKNTSSVWYKSFNIVSTLLEGIKVNDEVYEDLDDVVLKLNEGQEALTLELLGYNSDKEYKITTDYWQADSNAISFVDGIATIDVSNIATSRCYYIFAVKDGYSARCASITVSSYNPVKELTSISYDLNTGEFTAHKVEAWRDGTYDIYAEQYDGYNQFSGSAFITGLNIKFNEGYEDCTYKLIDERTNQEYDFTNIKDYAECNLYIYSGEEVIYRAPVSIHNTTITLEGGNLAYFNGEEDRYVLTDKGTYTFACLANEEEIVSDYDLEINGVASTTKEYNAYGIYIEKIKFSIEVFGITYTQEFVCDVICSENAADSADYRLTYIPSSWSSEEDYLLSYDNYNCFNCSFSSYSYLHLDERFLNYASHMGYTINGYDMMIINGDTPQLRRLVIKINVTDGSSTQHEYYCLVSTDDTFKGSLEIEDNELQIYSMFGDNRYITIESDEVVIDNAVRGDSFEIYFESSCRAIVYKDGEIYKDYSDEETYNISFLVKEAGTYSLLMKNFLDDERTITFTVSGYFDNILETSIGNEDDRTVLVFNNDKGDSIILKQQEPNSSTYVGYYGDASQAYIVSDTVDVNIGGIMFGQIFKDEDLTEPITNEVETFTVNYDENDNPYIIVYAGGDYFLVRIVLFLTDKPQGKAIIDFGYGDEFGIGFDEFGLYGDFETLPGEFPVYMFERSSVTTTFTLTTDQVYPDYSYSIIMADAGFMSVGLWEGDYTFYELYSMGYIYRVTNPSSLSITVPLTYSQIYVVNEGVNGSDTFTYESITMFYINSVNAFNLTIGDNEYYVDVNFNYEDYNWSITSDTNADMKQGENNYYDWGYLANTYMFCIGEDELENIDNNKYKFKYDSSFGFMISTDQYGNNIIKPDKKGYITVPVEEIGNIKSCSFYLYSYDLSDPILVQLMFIDEIPSESLEIVDEVIVRTNIITGISEIEIESDEVSIINVSTSDIYSITFEEKVDVELFYYEESIKTKYNTKTFEFALYGGGEYVLEITNFYGSTRVIYLDADGEFGDPFLVIPAGFSEADFIVYDGDLDMENIERTETGLVGYLGDLTDAIQEGVLAVPMTGYGLEYLYSDSNLNTPLDFNEDYFAPLEVLYEDETPYVEFYISTYEGPLSVILYITDAPLGKLYLTVGKKTYEIGLSDDDLGDLEKHQVGATEDEYIYLLDIQELDYFMTLTTSRTHYDYTNSLIYFASSDDYFMSLWGDGAQFESLEDNGYLFRTGGDKDSTEINVLSDGFPMQFYVVPKGYNSVRDMSEAGITPFAFYVQRNNYIFEILDEDNNYYVTNYTNFVSESQNRSQTANTPFMYDDNKDGNYDRIYFMLGDGSSERIYDNEFTFMMNSSYYNGIFYLDSAHTIPLDVAYGEYTTLVVQLDENDLQYVSFYYYGGYGLIDAEVRLYFMDGYYVPARAHIGEEIFDISYPGDLEMVTSPFDTDFEYLIIKEDNEKPLVFEFNEYYDDYSYALIYADTYHIGSYLTSGITVAELDVMGYILRPTSPSDLNVLFDYPVNGASFKFILLPYGTEASDFIQYSDYGRKTEGLSSFVIQKTFTVMDLEIGGNNYYYQSYYDFTIEGMPITDHHNADVVSNNGTNESIDTLIYLIGNDEQDNIVDDKYSFVLNTELQTRLFFSDSLGSQLEIAEDGTVTLDVFTEGAIKYVSFFVFNGYGDYVHIYLYLNDEIPQ